VAHLAKRQHGVFRRDQAIALGLSGEAIDKRVNRGHYDVVHPGVYKFAGVDLSRLGEGMAAVLAAEPEAFVAGRTAARFRGVDDRYDGPIEIAVKRPWRPDLKGVEAHTARLLPYETGTHRGVPCLTLPRLMLQLATVQDMDQLTRAYEKGSGRASRSSSSSGSWKTTPASAGSRSSASWSSATAATEASAAAPTKTPSTPG
jgi:hypothetical protein